MIINTIINHFYKQISKTNEYKQISENAICYLEERTKIIEDMENVLYEMSLKDELTKEEKRNYRLWNFILGELKIWCLRH